MLLLLSTHTFRNKYRAIYSIIKIAFELFHVRYVPRRRLPTNAAYYEQRQRRRQQDDDVEAVVF